MPFEPSGSEFFCTESGVSESFLYVVTSTSSRYTTRYVYDACQWRLVSGGHSQRHRAPAQGTPLQICRQVATNAVRAGINTRRTKVKQTNNYKDNYHERSTTQILSQIQTYSARNATVPNLRESKRRDDSCPREPSALSGGQPILALVCAPSRPERSTATPPCTGQSTGIAGNDNHDSHANRQLATA